MESIYDIGLDVHKKPNAYCIKTVTGKIVCQGLVKVERRALQQWLVDLPALGEAQWKQPCLPTFAIFQFYS